MELFGFLIKWLPTLLLPFSFIWDSVLYISFLYRYYLRKESNSHEDRVSSVQEQVRRWRTEGKGRKMCTARPSWKSITQQKLGYKDKLYRVEVHLDHVLEIDEKNMTVTVEPSVCIGFLNRLLVANGFTLAIVPELDLLTIGGLVMGGGLESTSHKEGLFDDICLEFEIVTADGQCLKADRKKINTDLFYAIPLSYGTLGFLTAVKLSIVPFKPYLKLTYRPTYTLEETVRVLDRESNKDGGNDSVEGIMFNGSQAVIMTGEFVEKSEVEWDKVNRMGLWFKPWFYKHVETFINKGEATEYIPTLDFHGRHNKPCFWLTPNWLPWGNFVIARYLFGWLLPMNTQLLKLLKEKTSDIDYLDNFILQDFIVPMDKLKMAVLISEEHVNVFPLWMVPCKLDLDQNHPRPPPRGGIQMYVDLGVYGHSPLKNYKGRDQTLKIFEKFSLENGGYQALYAETLLNREDFAKMFDGTLYLRVRNSLPHCTEAFPEVYEKVSRDGRKGMMANMKQ